MIYLALRRDEGARGDGGVFGAPIETTFLILQSPDTKLVIAYTITTKCAPLSTQ